MSSTRNKRKRPENDSIPTAPMSRRRSREPRAADEASSTAAKNQADQTKKFNKESSTDFSKPKTKTPKDKNEAPSRIVSSEKDTILEGASFLSFGV